MPRQTTRHRVVVKLIGDVRRLIAAGGEHAVGGRRVTAADLNVAEQIMLEPEARFAEELLEHAEELVSLDRVRAIDAEAAALMSPDDDGRALQAARALESWAAALLAQCLDAAPGPDPSFGALEMSLLPPFGQREND